MFVRISRIRPEKLEEYRAYFAQHGLATAKTQKGFRWAFALPPHAPSEEWLTISGWDAREDAETYNRHPDRNKTIVNAEDFFLEAPHATGYDDVIE